MAHYKSESFKNYHWVERFYEKMVKTFGQRQIDNLEGEMFYEEELEYLEKKAHAESNGWIEVRRGVFTPKN